MANSALGVCMIGEGVPQDYVSAHMWLNLAASRATGRMADVRAAWVKIRDSVAARMTREEISQAQQRAREWEFAQRGGR